MPLPELTPEQLEQLNAISGLGKTRKRKDAPSGDNLPDVAPADLMQTALQQDDNAGFEPFSLPERTPDMDNEVYEGLIKESLQQQLGAIYDRARQRADANRTKMLAPFDEAIEADIPAWKKAFIAQAKSSTLRSPSGLGGDDTYLMQATERALKLLNQKTVKDKQAGDKSSGIAREVFDWGTLGDLATMGFGELGENIAITRALKKAAKGEHLTPTERDMIDLLRYGELINQYTAQRGGPTTGAKVGSGIAASLPYMAGFGATSKIGSSGANTLGKMLLKKEAKTLLGKGLRKLGEYTASAAVMTPLQAGTYSNYHERAQGQYEVKDNGEVVEHLEPQYNLMYKAAADSFTDVFTEHIGGELGAGVKKVLGWPVEQIGRRLGIKLSLDRFLPGYTRSKYLTDFRNRTLWNGPVDEWLEEVAGGVMSPLLTGEHERWKENLSGENLWTTFLTTSLMGAGFSALELPNVASYAHKNHVLKTQEKKALSSIENETLRAQVFEAMQKPTMAEQSQALAAIDWQAANINQIDAAHAADYTRFHIERQILDGMELGDTQGKQIQQTAQTANAWAYRGVDGKSPTEDIITGQRADGKAYVVLSGNLDTEGPDGTLFVLDTETGTPTQIDRAEFESFASTPVAEFSAEQLQISEQQAAAEHQKRQQRQDMEIGTEAGIDPDEVVRVVAPEAPQYTNGDEVVTTDGVRGRITGKHGSSYVLQLDDGQFVSAPLHTIKGPASQIQETDPTEAAIPLGNNDTNSGQADIMPTDVTPQEDVAARLAETMQAAVGKDEAPRAIQRMIDGTTDANQVQIYSAALERLQNKSKGMPRSTQSPVAEGPAAAVPARNPRPDIPKFKRETPTPYAKPAAELGDYLSIEDVILRDVASGLKFAWKDNGQRRGLARELGFSGSESERRSRVGILSPDGMTPDQYAERLYFQYGAGNNEGNGYRWDMDDMTIKDAVLDVLSRIHSPRQAYMAAAQLHQIEPHPYDDMTGEEYEQMQEHEARVAQMQDELLYDSAFVEWAGQTTPEQWAEIDNLFTEGTDNFAENANFEALAAKPAPTTEQTPKTTSNDNNSQRTEQPAPAADGESSSDVGRGERSDPRTGDDADFGQPESEPRAVRHGRGLDAISGDLTDEERKVAEDAAASTDATVEQLRAALKRKQAQYTREKQSIGSAYNEDNQTILFEQPQNTAEGNLFDVPRDFSQQVVETILKPLQAEIDNLQETIFKVEASKGKIIADAIAAHRAQQRLSFNDTPQAAPQAPVGPKSTDAEFTPAVRTEYNQYLTHAIKTFPDKVFSILHNDLIKAGFVRDVRRLAKKDATAAIKLVAEVNAAAEKYAGKQVLTSRHSIFAELEKMQAAQASASMKATSPSTEQSSIFKPTEHTRHSKTGAELYSVKLADRVERAIFDDLKKRAKAHDGYYSSYTRSFLFNTSEDAEAFRAEQKRPDMQATPAPLNDMPAAPETYTGNNAGHLVPAVSAEKKSDTEYNAAEKPTEYGAQNKLVTSERYEELKRQMRAKLGQLNTGFDPEILAIGTQMAAFHVEAGARRFADYARRMLADLGEAIRPYLKPTYVGALHMPGMEEYTAQMDTYSDVMHFDLDSLDKPQSAAGQGAAPSPAIVPEADTQRRLAGRYDTTGTTEKDIHETGNLRPEKKFRKDLTQFSKELVKALGWEHKTDKKGKTLYAETNIAPAGGDGSITLLPADSEYGIYINIPVHPSGYIASSDYTDDLVIEDILGAGSPILYRVCTTTKSYLLDAPNRYAPADITVGEMAELAKNELNSYIRRKNAPEPTTPDASDGTKPNNHENPANNTDRMGPDSPLGNGRIPAGDASAYVPRGTEGVGNVDRGNRRQSVGLEESGAGERERPAVSRRTVPGTSETGLLSGGTRANHDQRGTDGRDRRRSGKNSRNHVIERGRDIAPHGEVSKIKANLSAIRLVKQLEAEEREATADEKAVLEQFTGWGGLSSVFKGGNSYFNELQELLTPEEYEAARASTTTSFYTPPEIVSSVWDMIERLGFAGGSVLEPSAGIGHFFGLMPAALSAKSNLAGVEIDEISGRILRALYPDATVRVEGFEQQRIPNNRYDLIVTNVPFGAIKVHDTFDKDLSAKFDIHDYFIAKSVRKLKPGGLGVFITATSTLDRSTALRNWVVADGNADFIGAVRLNTATFKQAAGTETSADIIIIRKRDEAGQSSYAANMQTTVLEREAPYIKYVKNDKGRFTSEDATARMVYNKYYFDHPEFMAGQMRFGFESGVEIRPTEQRCIPVVAIDQNQVIKQFIASLPTDLYSVTPSVPEQTRTMIAPDGTKEGALTLIDGKPHIVQFGSAIPVDWNRQNVKGRSKTVVLKEYLELKKTIYDLLDAENKDLPNIERLRAELNNLYTKFTHRYGTLSKNTSLTFLRDDVDYPAIAAIENVEESNNPGEKKRFTITKSDIFSRRVIEPVRQPKAENEKDAIALSLYHRGRLDLPYIAELLHKSQEDVQDAMLTQELAYINPVTGLVEERSEFLSGNVRDKLLQGEQAKENGLFNANIRALSKIIPLDVPLPQIKISLGSTWVPTELYERFFHEKFNVEAKITKTAANKYIARITNKGNTVDASMGVADAPGSRLALDRMNKTQTYLSKKEWDSLTNKEKKVKDPEAMAQAAIKQTELDEAFEQWCKQQDEATTDKLTEIYNTAFNSIVERQIDVSTFDYFPNAAHTKKPREHQKIGVMRGLQGPTLLAHEVGTGKTITLISTAMEMRRLGIAHKPCIVVQRSTYEQFVNEIKSLYPAARVLVPSAKDLTASQRQQLFAKIAYNDWDIVVLYHGYLDAIPDDPIRVNQYIDGLIEEKVEQLKEVEASNPDNAKRLAYGIKKEIEGLEKKKVGSEKSIKEEEKVKSNARAQAQRLLDRRTDETMTFEQLGIDALLVDEAHAYKKLGFTTDLQNIKGIDPAASQRAQSLRLKSTYILENNSGKNVVLATGTPISNTMAEMWTFMRYLLPQNVLQEYNIDTFDAFASNFGSIEESAEFGTNGKFKVAQRFASYSNMPELLAIWQQIAHVVLTEDVSSLREGVGTPRLDGGKPTDIMLDQTPALRKVMRSIRDTLERFDAMPAKQKRENSHIPLVMFGLAKRAAIDVRLINPDLPDEPGSKVNNAVREILADLKSTDHYKGTAAIFCDSYQSRDRRFNVFEDIKRKFIAAGITAEQIAIIHDYNTDEQKARLFRRVNNGDVRIVMGTTEKLGIGVNMQERLHLLVNLDVPIRPMDYMQRVGRIIRQGNSHLKMDLPVRILRLGVKQTLDVTGYQRLKIKEAFIRQVMKGDISSRTLEEPDAESSDSTNFGQMMASLSGSQAALALSLAQNNLRKLRNARDYHYQHQAYVTRNLKWLQNILDTTPGVIATLEKQGNEFRKIFPDNTIVSVEYGSQKAENGDYEKLFAPLNKRIEAEADALRKTPERDHAELKTTIRINGKTFDIKIGLKKTWALSNEKDVRIFRGISYVCEEAPEIKGDAGAKISNVLEQVAYTISGKWYIQEIESRQLGLETAKQDYERLQAQVSGAFPKQAELEATEARIAELEAQMAAELAEIEAQQKADTDEEAIDIDPDELLDDAAGDSIRFRDGSSWFDPERPASDNTIAHAATRLAKKLNTPVEIVADLTHITDNDPLALRRKRRAKGYYDPTTGRVVIVMPNITTRADAEATVLHEIVGHMGLRSLLGERFGLFLDNVHKSLDETGVRAVADMMAQEQKQRSGKLTAVEARRLATEEYLARLAEGNITPSRFARIIGRIRSMLREALRLPLRISDRDIAYMLWLSKHRRMTAKTAGAAVTEAATAHRIRQQLYSVPGDTRYRVIFDDAIPENIERYAVEQYVKERHIIGTLFENEHVANDFALRAYALIDDMGRTIIDHMGPDRLKSMRKYLALFDLQKLTDKDSYRRVIDELVATLPSATKQEIMRTMSRHLQFVMSDKYRSPLRRRTMASERPLPENFKYAGEFVEELLKQKRKQPEMAPSGNIEPTVIYDKQSWKNRQYTRLIDSTLPVQQLQEVIKQRGGQIDDLTDLHKHLNHLSSVTKTAIDKYTKEYLDPILDCIVGISKQTGMTEDNIIDYITAESSLERHASGIAALSEDQRDPWNDKYARKLVADFRRRAGDEQTQQLWQAINAANDRVLDILVEDGMLAPEHRKLIKGHGWAYYVPLCDYDYNFEDSEGNPQAFDATEIYDFMDEIRGPRPLRQVLHEAEGRTNKPRNPVAQMVNIGIGAIIAAKTNRARQAALRLAQNNSRGSDDLFRVDKVWLAKGLGNRWVTTTINPSVEDIEISQAARKEIARLKKELDAALNAHDDELAVYLENRIDETERLNIVRPAEADSRFENEGHMGQSIERQRNIECFENGIRHKGTFACAAWANAINQYNRLTIPKWLDDTVGNATRWLAQAFTSRNPAFVAANFLRDVQHAALIHGIDPGGDLRGFMRNIPPSMATITRNVRGKSAPLKVAELGRLDILNTADRKMLIEQYGPERVMDALYEYFRDNGGETGFVHSKDVAEAEKEIKRYVAFRTGRVAELAKAAQPSERPGIWLSYAAQKSGAKAIATGLENASKVAENTSRFATFLASLDQGKSLLVAIDEAKNVTVNFNRRGTATRPLGMFYVFFNASVQGAAQIARVAFKNRKRFAKVVASLAAAGFLDSLLLDFFLAGSGDDGRDLVVSEYEKRNHLIIPYMGKNGFLKIPLPQGFRAFYGIGSLLHDLYRGKVRAEDAARTMLTLLYEDFSPVASPSPKGDATRVLIPTALTPWYDIWYAGEDAFGYPVGRRSYGTTNNYPLSEMGLKNVNKAIYYLCRGINRLGGGDENTPAGQRKNGEIDPLLRGIFEWNPSHVEHVLTYYGGGMGKFAKDMVHTTQAILTPGEEISSRDLPILNRFYGTARPENPAGSYYNLKDCLTNIAAKYKRLGPALDRQDPEVQRNLQRITIFKAHQTAVNKLRKILSDTRPNTPEYDRLREELNETMVKTLNEDENVTEY
jgi:N12 class adenine-specific DNA methylase